MRIAALSDIHGNLQALDAVLADIAQNQMGKADHLAYEMMLPYQVIWFEGLPLTLEVAPAFRLSWLTER